MFHKIVAALTALNLLWSVVATTGSAWAAEASAVEETVVEKEKPPRMMRTIMGMDDGTWAVVDVRKVKGNLVVLSPVVGPEIDLEESNRFALFQGRTVFNEKIKIGLFNMAVPGFQSAVFFLGRNDRPMVRVRFRSGAEIQSRTMPLKDKEELRRLREYVEHFDDIQKKEYALEDTSKLAEDAEYPVYTQEWMEYEEQRPRFGPRWRTPGGVVLKNGERVKGELLPDFEDGRVLIQTDIDTRRVAVDEIDRVFIKGGKSSAALGNAFQRGIGGALSGALLGALAAWQAGASAKKTAVFSAGVFGALGFVSGLLTGARQGRGNREFVLGPVERGNRDDEAGEGARDRRR